MMQKKVQIISDGSLDLSQELTKEKDIEVVPFYVSFDSETYQKEMVEVGVREFYQEMVDHPDVYPKSSMITRPFSQRHPCHPCMIIMRCLKNMRRSSCRSSVSVSPENSVAPCSLRQLQKI